MRKIILCLIGTAIFATCRNSQSNKREDIHYNWKIFKTQSGQFGYDIYQDSSRIIHQPVIPVVEGNEGFKTPENAAVVAKLIVSKLSSGISPPSITLNELDSLNISVSK